MWNSQDTPSKPINGSMIDSYTILEFGFGLTQPYKIGLLGVVVCPPVITTIQVIRVSSVKLLTPAHA